MVMIKVSNSECLMFFNLDQIQVKNVKNAFHILDYSLHIIVLIKMNVTSLQFHEQVLFGRNHSENKQVFNKLKH